MKVIETVYKGCKFRSRLEARWAMVFDVLGIEWMYEKEAFDLDVCAYLPDFFLPKFKAWIEVKSPENLSTDDNWMKARKLHSFTGQSVWVVGQLENDGRKLFVGDDWQGLCGQNAFGDDPDACIYPDLFQECRRCEAITLQFPPCASTSYCLTDCTSERLGIVSERILNAFSAARSHRFYCR